MEKRFLLSLLMLLSLLDVVAVEIDGIYYNLDSDKQVAEVISGPKGYSGSIDIPSFITYREIQYSVTSISIGAFYNCKDLTSITIPISVTYIPSSAFQGCVSLVTIVIPESVTSIGDYAFLDTEWYKNQPDGLVYAGKVLYKHKGTIPENTSIKIREGTLGIAAHAFEVLGRNNIIAVTIPNSLINIDYGAFTGCTGITSVTIPNSVTNIGPDVFAGCSSLKTITLPDNLKEICTNTFRDCRSLTSITIPKNVTKISDAAFYKCSSLSSVTILGSPVLYNGNMGVFYNSAFVECPLKEVTIEGVNVSMPFQKITSIEKVILKDNVRVIKENVFEGCKGITHITFGGYIENIESKAFAGLEKLEEVTCYSKNVPNTNRTAFENSYVDYATLYVPEESIGAYKNTAPWSGFKQTLPIKNTLPDDAEQCSIPTIKYENGILTFDCTTENVTFVSNITDTDIKQHYNATISLTATYRINVYAAKKGCKNSEIATATLCWIDVDPKTEGITNGVANVRANPVLIQSNGNVLSISGAPEGAEINVYTLSGQQIRTAVSPDDATEGLHKGLYIVGKKKVMVK